MVPTLNGEPETCVSGTDRRHGDLSHSDHLSHSAVQGYVKREKERELRHTLWEMPDAIDRYKTRLIVAHSEPKWIPTLPTRLGQLVKGEDVSGKKLKFLRRIPIDPMTGNTDLGVRAQCRMIPTRTPGMGRTSSMLTASPKELR